MLKLILNQSAEQKDDRMKKFRKLKNNIESRLLFNKKVTTEHRNYLKSRMYGMKDVEFYINKINKSRKLSKRERELLLLFWKINQLFWGLKYTALKIVYSAPVEIIDIFRARIKNHIKIEKRRAEERKKTIRRPNIYDRRW